MAFSAGKQPEIHGPTKGGVGEEYTGPGAKKTAYSQYWGGAQSDYGNLAAESLQRAQSGDTSVAQQQMQMGLGQAQQAMAAQAGAQGSNPLAQRAAVYGGQQMAQDAVAQSAALRAQEMQAAQQQMAQYYQQLAQGQMGFEQMKMQGNVEEERLKRDWYRHKTEQEAAERGFAMQLVGTGASMIGAGAMSDIGAKQGVAPASAAEQDYTIGALQGYRATGMGDTAPTTVIDTSKLSQEQRASLPGWEFRPGQEPTYQPPMADPNAARLQAIQALAAGQQASGTSPAGKGSDEAAAGGQAMQQGMGMIGQAMAASDVRLKEMRGGSLPRGEVSHYPRGGAAQYQGHGGYGIPEMGGGSLPRQEVSYYGPGQFSDVGLKQPAYSDVNMKQPAYSDERMKAALAADETMRGMPMHRYRYTPEAQAKLGLPGDERAGIMAQDLERTPLGGAAVQDTPNGKMLDVGTSTGLQYGLIGRLGERQDATEAAVLALAQRLQAAEGKRSK